MRMLAAFASSAAGKTYGRVCEMWGVDPAAPLEEADDVLAANLRLALAVSRNPTEPKPSDPIDKTRQAGAAIRRRMSG